MNHNLLQYQSNFTILKKLLIKRIIIILLLSTQKHETMVLFQKRAHMDFHVFNDLGT